MTQFYIIHGNQEKFFDQKRELNNMEAPKEYQFDPAQLVGREDISIIVSNCAPRSNASYEEAAMKLMELQMKYNPAEHGYPDFITPIELVKWLNIPKSQQNVLAERMQMQMENMKLEEYSAVLTAIGTLTQGGMKAEQALMMVVQQMQSSAVGQLPAQNPNPGQPMTK